MYNLPSTTLHKVSVSNRIHLYNSSNLDELRWENYYNGRELKDFLVALVTQPSQELIRNLDGEIQILTLDDHLLPLTISNPKARGNAYITSPYSQYINLAKEEIQMEVSDEVWMKHIANPTLNVTGALVRQLGFDKAIFINNWIVSTNLYPKIDFSLLPELVNFLTKHFPDYALIFRSINEYSEADWLQELKSIGFRSVLSRQVYVMNPEDEEYRKKRMFKSDQKLWTKNKDYVWEILKNPNEEDLQQIKKLYDDLYLNKYSSLNPDYTLAWLKKAIQSNFMDFHILRHQETQKIGGVTAFFEKEGVITTPLIGYDQSVPLKVGLYRFLNLRLMEESIERNLVMNMSSGAAKFKKMRGGVPYLEYNMTYTRHLPYHQQFSWWIFDWFGKNYAAPTMKKYEI